MLTPPRGAPTPFTLQTDAGPDGRQRVRWQAGTSPTGEAVTAPPELLIPTLGTKLVTSPLGALFGRAVLSPWWQALGGVVLREGLSRTQLVRGRAAYEFVVGASCTIAGRHGLEVTVFGNRRRLAVGCIDPSFPMPLSAQTYDANGKLQLDVQLQATGKPESR